MSKQIKDPKQNKKVLVTGASGFIGSHLTRRLCNEGADVTILTLYNDIINNIRINDLWNNLNIIEGDVRDLDSLKQFKKHDFDVVFHLAAYNHVGDSFTHITQNLDVNGRGTPNVLESTNFGRFVYMSTSEIYGLQKQVPFKEDFDPSPLSPYSIGKYTGELYCRMKMQVENKHITVVRSFNNFGPYQSQKAIIPELIINCLKGEEIKTTEGKQTREFNFVSNIVDGLLLAAEKKEALGEIINLGSGEDISIAELAKKIHEFSNSKSELKIGALEYRPTEIWKMYCDNTKAKEILDWKPNTSFDEGLKITIDWFRRFYEIYYGKESQLTKLGNNDR